jgi:hypothetical protein
VKKSDEKQVKRFFINELKIKANLKILMIFMQSIRFSKDAFVEADPAKLLQRQY